jgi:hypothetical protein
MEALSWMLIAAMDQGHLTGFTVGHRDSEAFSCETFTVCQWHVDFWWCARRTNLTSAVYLLMI